MKTRMAIVFMALAICSITFETCTVTAMGKNKQPAASQAKIGERVPDLELADLEGKAVRLLDYRGTVILLEFWATWCPDCREVLPHIQKLSGTAKEKGLSVVTVSVDTKADTVRDFMKENGYTFPVLHGGLEVRELFAVKAIPTLYLIDRAGTIRTSMVEYGESGVRELDRRIKQLLDE